MIARELTRVLRRLRRRTGSPVCSAAGRPDLPLQRQRLLRARLLGGDPLPRGRLLRGPGVRRATCWRPAGRRSTSPARRCCTPTTTARSSSCAATSTSTAACARAPATSSRSRRSPPRATCADAVAADRRWMAERGMSAAERARWTARSVAHHGGRRVFSALGSRAERVPAPLRRRLSLEGRDDGGDRRDRAGVNAAASAAHSWPERGRVQRQRQRSGGGRAAVARAADHRARRPDAAPTTTTTSSRASGSEGPAPLLEPVPGMAERERLRLALVIPPFSRGSGGHNTLFQIFSRLEQRGHACSVWLADYHNHMRDVWPARDAPRHPRILRAVRGAGVQGLRGAGRAPTWRSPPAGRPCTRRWRSTARRARAYVVNDHEPEFYAASTEQVLAAGHLPPRPALHRREPVAARPADRALRRERRRLPARASTATPTIRCRCSARTDTVIYYARHATPRRAVPIGLMALAELHRRRPDVRIVLFGTDKPLHAAFPYEHMGVLTPAQLARLYSEATVGLCLSLTNFSLMPKEMLACGLPCVELAGVSAESIFGEDGAARPRPAATRRGSPTRWSGCSPTRALRERRSREGRRVRRLAHLGPRHRRGRSGAAPRAARARSHLRRLTYHRARLAQRGRFARSVRGSTTATLCP